MSEYFRLASSYSSSESISHYDIITPHLRNPDSMARAIRCIYIYVENV
jgi:hypothetical protein